MSNSLDDTIKKYCDDLMQIYKNKTELKCDSSNLNDDSSNSNETPSTEPFADLNENNLNNQNQNKNKNKANLKANQQNLMNKNAKTYPWPNSDKNNN